MKANKYIVLKEGGRWGMALGFVEFHRELASTEELAYGMVKGGGMFKVDHDKKQILFYGKSDDFGYPDNIDVALASCYYQIRDQIADLEFCRTHDEYNLHDYTIWYQDMLGNNLAVIPVRETTQMEINTYEMLPQKNLSTYYAPTSKGKNSKHQVAKDAKKKAKTKRREQKRARRHK